MKEVITFKPIVHYTGECPQCHEPQKSSYKSNVDMKCITCKKEEQTIKDKFQERVVKLDVINSTIIDADTFSGKLTGLTFKNNGKTYIVACGDTILISED